MRAQASRGRPEVTIVSTPGHVSVTIESKGERSLSTGDFVHHPCQNAHPDARDATPAVGTSAASRISMLRLGLCCGFVAEEAIHFRTTTARYASGLSDDARRGFLFELAEHNVATLRDAVVWCASHGIGAFRVPSGLLPMYTHPLIGWRLSPAKARTRAIAAGLRSIGTEARRLGVRLSFHPDQFVVLGSASASSVALAVSELEYQAECAELLGAEQLTVHGGGATPTKKEALERLRRNLSRLSPRARRLIALENDDRVYTVTDLLPICRAEGIPLVYDVHHHRCNPDALSVREATTSAAETWEGREPWMHLSSPAGGWSARDPRPHADYIAPADVPREWLGLRATVDVEAKQKELAVLRLHRWMRDHAPSQKPRGGSAYGAGR